uniref:Uncharacterized protein n=1 Tax=Anopheles merus TaxID=30066 RepID=A0A182V377_ANOME
MRAMATARNRLIAMNGSGLVSMYSSPMAKNGRMFSRSLRWARRTRSTSGSSNLGWAPFLLGWMSSGLANTLRRRWRPVSTDMASIFTTSTAVQKTYVRNTSSFTFCSRVVINGCTIRYSSAGVGPEAECEGLCYGCRSAFKTDVALNSELIVPPVPPPPAELPGALLVLPVVLPAPPPPVCSPGWPPDTSEPSLPVTPSSGASCSWPSFSWAGMLRRPLAVLTKCGRKRCGMPRWMFEDGPEVVLLLPLSLPPPLLWYASMYW